MLSALNFLKGKPVGTPLYLSPEVINLQTYDHRVDVWAFGCVMYELATLEPPFIGENMRVLMSNILYKRPRYVQGCYS